eukprot:8887309-Alexandrium_andersonii.AAC.1
MCIRDSSLPSPNGHHPPDPQMAPPARRRRYMEGPSGRWAPGESWGGLGAAAPLGHAGSCSKPHLADRIAVMLVAALWAPAELRSFRSTGL